MQDLSLPRLYYRVVLVTHCIFENFNGYTVLLFLIFFFYNLQFLMVIPLLLIFYKYIVQYYNGDKLLSSVKWVPKDSFSSSYVQEMHI